MGRGRGVSLSSLYVSSQPSPPIGPPSPRLGSIAEIDLGVPPPIMKSFKEFLLSLDDSVDETEAVKRYNDYKLDFRRQQMQDFFLAHKDEEW